MNRLWIRLSLAFAAVVIVAFSTVVFTAVSLVSTQRIQNYVTQQVEQQYGLRDTVSAYYRARGNWQGIEILLQGADALLMSGPGAPYARFAVLDRDGTILQEVRLEGAEQGSVEHILPEQISVLSPIAVEGETVGHLAIILPVMDKGKRLFELIGLISSGNNAPGMLQEFSRFLLSISLMGGVLGIIFGVAVSRTLTAPLANLVEAAQAIGSRRWSYRVPIKGSEELRAVSASFNEMAAALESAESRRQNMLADVAHELRTPLTVLQGNLRAMIDGVYPLDQIEVARLYDQTRHLHRLIEDLHTLAQAEARQLPLHCQPLVLSEIAAEATSLFEPIAEEKGVRLLYESSAYPVQVYADRARLMQVMQNLLNNALRHTPSGGTITVQIRSDGKEALLVVSDTGEGIAPEHVDRVFERFYRTDKARAHDSGGAGLGLAIVRALVEAHEGHVDLFSPGIGKGSTFRLRLPMA